MFSTGIIGLPNVGKSTLFNALIKQAKALVSNYPFTTIEPNVGIIEVPDENLDSLAKKMGLSKKIPTAIKFIDIAGLIKGAHKGEGLGNQFLSHIKECDCLIEIVRFFKNPDIVGLVDPESDLETIKIELVLKDLETLNKLLEKLKADPSRESIKKIAVLNKVKEGLEKEIPVLDLDLSFEERDLIKEFNFLTLKPIILIANVSESELNKSFELKRQRLISVSVKLEAELGELSLGEAQEYLTTLGLKESGVKKIIQEAYKSLDLITFYTLKEDQIQAWTLKKGEDILGAAGKIHSDFKDYFVLAQVIKDQELLNFNSFKEALERGKVRSEGKNYIVQNGDVVYFKISK